MVRRPMVTAGGTPRAVTDPSRRIAPSGLAMSTADGVSVVEP